MFTFGKDGFEAEISEDLCSVAVVHAVDDRDDAAIMKLLERLVDSVFGQYFIPWFYLPCPYDPAQGGSLASG